MKPHVLHPEAREEYCEAARHYADILSELGGRFYDEIERLIADACRTPGTFRFIRKPARRNFSRRFSYGIIHVDRPEHILILAVMHLHREPGYWKKRPA